MKDIHRERGHLRFFSFFSHLVCCRAPSFAFCFLAFFAHHTACTYPATTKQQTPKNNMSDDHEPRRRWNRRNSDGAAWGGENSTNNNNTDDHRTRSYYREPVQISAEFRERIAAAARASIVTLTTFSLLVFSGQEVLPVAWIGNVFAISVLKPTLGGTFLSARDVFVPMIPVALISWAVSAALSVSSTEVYRIVLPFVVALAAMVVFLCPWPHLTMKNLMLLIFYLSAGESEP